MYIHLHVSFSLYIHIYVLYICICIYLYYIYMYVYIYINTHIWYIYIIKRWIDIYVYIYLHYLHMYTCICIDTYSWHLLSRIHSISELSLSQTFHLVPSAFSLTSFINPFGISNSAILNFHYVKQFSGSLQSFLGCFPSTISNIRMRFLNESYCSFQSFKF